MLTLNALVVLNPLHLLPFINWLQYGPKGWCQAEEPIYK